MERVYQILQISRQAIHKNNVRDQADHALREKLLKQARSLRKRHPRLGCRKLANRIKDSGYGRDKSETLLLKNGFRIRRKIKHVRTTQSQQQLYFPNLIQGLELTGKNQLFQTDITYYRVGTSHYYITFILDVFTRRIIGHNVGRTLKATENIKAMQMALRTRRGESLRQAIHHSDRGVQYIDKDYLDLLKREGMRISMCENAWENAYGERINRTIKEEYLDALLIKNFEQLKSQVDRAVWLYNTERSHQSLHCQMSPNQFEKYIESTVNKSPLKMKLYQSLEELSTKN